MTKPVIIKTTFMFRRAKQETWITKNPILAYGEPGFELETSKLKIGDGIHTWLELPYIGGAQDYVLNYNTKADFPKPGTLGVIYKAQLERKIYQWNADISDYELLSDPGDIEIKIINGGHSADE